MKFRKILAAATLATGLAAPTTTLAADTDTNPTYGFSALKAMSPEAAKAKCETWLKSTGKFDQAKFDAVWSEKGRTVLDRVADSIALGNPDAAKLVADARNPNALAPATVPEILSDTKLDPFVRSNLALFFAKSAANRKAYEESLKALKDVTPEQVVDPATFLFFKAVAAHATMQKKDGMAAAERLRNDVPDAPDRYRMLAILLYFDMDKWPDDPKEFSNIERLMDNSGRRLDLARPDPTTQEIQRKIVFRLDELIKEKDNQANGGGGGGQANKGQCPNGGQPGGGQAPGNGPGDTTNPQKNAQDSQIMGGAGKNKDINKDLQLATQNWGSLPKEERAKIIDQLTREYPAKYKPMIDDYFKSLNKVHGFPSN